MSRLTPAGRRLFRRLRATDRDGVRRRFAVYISGEELRELAQLLERLAEAPQ